MINQGQPRLIRAQTKFIKETTEKKNRESILAEIVQITWRKTAHLC